MDQNLFYNNLYNFNNLYNVNDLYHLHNKHFYIFGIRIDENNNLFSNVLKINLFGYDFINIRFFKIILEKKYMDSTNIDESEFYIIDNNVSFLWKIKSIIILNIYNPNLINETYDQINYYNYDFPYYHYSIPKHLWICIYGSILANI